MRMDTQTVTYRDGDTELTGHFAWDAERADKRPGILVAPGSTRMPRDEQSGWRNWVLSYLLATCMAMAWLAIANALWPELRNCATILPNCASGHAQV